MGTHRFTRLRSEHGFSLIEMTVATAILTIVLASAFSFFSASVQRGAEATEQTHLQSETRFAVDQMVRELRQATSADPALVATPALVGTPQINTITFFSPDAASPYHMREISYTLTGTTLQRAVISSTDTDGYPWIFPTTTPAFPSYSTILTSVRNVGTGAFSYFDSSGNPLTGGSLTASAVAMVGITLDLDPFPSAGAGAMRYQTSVHLRSVS